MRYRFTDSRGGSSSTLPGVCRSTRSSSPPPPRHPVVLIAGPAAPADRLAALTDAGVEVIACPGEGPNRIQPALVELGRLGVTSLLLEGGATLAGAFRDAGELDELRLFYAPIVLGGSDSRPLLGGGGSPRIAEAERPIAVAWEPSGDDMLARVRMREW